MRLPLCGRVARSVTLFWFSGVLCFHVSRFHSRAPCLIFNVYIPVLVLRLSVSWMVFFVSSRLVSCHRYLYLYAVILSRASHSFVFGSMECYLVCTSYLYKPDIRLFRKLDRPHEGEGGYTYQCRQIFSFTARP